MAYCHTTNITEKWYTCIPQFNLRSATRIETIWQHTACEREHVDNYNVNFAYLSSILISPLSDNRIISIFSTSVCLDSWVFHHFSRSRDMKNIGSIKWVDIYVQECCYPYSAVRTLTQTSGTNKIISGYFLTWHIGGFAHHCGNSIVVALPSPQSCSKPSMYRFIIDANDQKLDSGKKID